MNFILGHQLRLVCSLVALFLCLEFSLSQRSSADWNAEWKRTVDAAKKEGQVTIYTGGYERVFAEFQKTFPEIKVLIVRGRSSGITARIMAERRAGKYLPDLYNGGISS